MTDEKKAAYERAARALYAAHLNIIHAGEAFDHVKGCAAAAKRMYRLANKVYQIGADCRFEGPWDATYPHNYRLDGERIEKQKRLSQ